MLQEKRRLAVAKTLFDEKNEFQQIFIDHLVDDNGYIKRDNKNFDSTFAMDRDLLFKFLYDTQAETMAELREIYKDDTHETILNFINNEITKPRGSLINVLKNEIEISNRKLALMYTKPATTYNKDLLAKYESNIFSLMEEVIPGSDGRVDVVIFLNGFAIMTFELKSKYSGQNYKDAITQYKEDRNPNNRLFRFMSGSIVNFAMDTDQVHMTTKLDYKNTSFLPFNRGRGEGLSTGAGNPLLNEDFPVAYMWKDILKKDLVIELIKKFVYIETKLEEDPLTAKKTHKQTLIFPRYHQLDLVRKLIEDISVNKTSKNYLIEHSAGSGKTNSIAWLAHRLVSLHDSENNIIYNTVIIMTDRVVVDRQLQDAVRQIDHQPGLIRTLGDDSSSFDLKMALEENTKIIATTIQKFPYVVDELKKMSDKTFAVIIDEAHSSTSGKNMQAVSKALSTDEDNHLTIEDMIVSEIQSSGKQKNVSMFAFTATPKPTTLRMFGRLNSKGQYEAFHLYSMKQAIEEGFIIDVLSNYTTYSTLYQVNKKIEDDPELESSAAKRQIARFIDLHETNISQRVEIIIEHFRQNVMNELGGQAKAMVVTASREAAVKYKLAFEKYIRDHGYGGISALVAFSGKLSLDGDDKEYTEYSMNKIRDEHLPKAFDTDQYNVLIVANKYQTGFDQKKLAAMYVLKKLSGVNAVQTLSRLNRVFPPYEKKIIIIDFVNSYEQMQNAFKPYYETTILGHDFTPEHIYDLEAQVDAYNFIWQSDIDRAINLIFKRRSKNIADREARELLSILDLVEGRVRSYPTDDQEEYLLKLKNFVRFYEFLIQVSIFEDVELHKKYIFITYLLKQLNIGESGPGFDIKDKIEASNFEQIEGETIINRTLVADPIVSLPVSEAITLPEDKKKRLSEIIEEINFRFGKNFADSVGDTLATQIRDDMLKNRELRKAAQNNNERDFTLAYKENVEEALVNGIDRNQDFYTILLNNKDIQEAFLGLYVTEIYKSLRQNSVI